MQSILTHSSQHALPKLDTNFPSTYLQLGKLALLKEQPYTARAEFEAALTHYADHPDAIIGLSDILLDIYSEKLLPDPTVQPLQPPGTSFSSATAGVSLEKIEKPTTASVRTSLPTGPLGLGRTAPSDNAGSSSATGTDSSSSNPNPADPRHQVREMLAKHMEDLATPGPIQPQPPSHPASKTGSGAKETATLAPAYKATSLPLVDRLAARDRAYGLLAGLTRLGAGWNRADAWFALARAHEESGQLDKAKDVLWWCVELEEGTGVRGWESVGCGGYVLLL